MDNELLKQRIRDLIDRLPNMARQDSVDVLFNLVKEYQLAETKDGVITLSDLNRIHDLTLKEYQDISIPFFVGGEKGNEQQRKTYCYLVGVIGLLHSLGLLKRDIHAKKDQPIYEPNED